MIVEQTLALFLIESRGSLVEGQKVVAVVALDKHERITAKEGGHVLALLPLHAGIHKPVALLAQSQDGRSEVFLVLAPCKHDRLGTRCLEELVNRQQRVRDGRRIVKLV